MSRLMRMQTCAAASAHSTVTARYPLLCGAWWQRRRSLRQAGTGLAHAQQPPAEARTSLAEGQKDRRPLCCACTPIGPSIDQRRLWLKPDHERARAV